MTPFAIKTFCAVFWREAYAVVQNRFLYGFSAVVLASGLAPYFLTGGDVRATAPLVLLQAVLYLVSLFAMLIGLSSAHGEHEESAVLLSHPVSRPGIVAGKFLALWATLALGLVGLIVPSLLANGGVQQLLLLGCGGVLIAGTFLSFGLAIGMTCRNQTRGLILGILVWLLFLVGFDALALVGAGSAFFQDRTAIWVGQLMLNPLDAFRIAGLFLFQEVPEAVAGDKGLVKWWLNHLGGWLGVISIAWMGLALIWSARVLERREV